MAEVVHTIKGNEYLYVHIREGDKVVCKYVGPVGSKGNIRAAKHGGGAPPKVTQQEDTQTQEGKTINNKKDNSRPGQKKPEEKCTMNEDELRNELKGAEHALEAEETRHTKYIKEHREDTDGKKASHKKYMAALNEVTQLKNKIRIIEIQEKNKGKPVKPEKPYRQYEGVTARNIDTSPLTIDPAHKQRMRAADEWQRKHDSD